MHTHLLQSIASLKELRVIYLHGNRITDIREIYKLNKLPELRKLTLFGNDVIVTTLPVTGATAPELAIGSKKMKSLEDTKHYRLHVIWALRNTMLISLDNVTITPKDRENALQWAEQWGKKKKSDTGSPVKKGTN